MAYRLNYTFNLTWVPDGAGPMSVPSAQTLGFTGTQLVPGGDAPTTSGTQVTSANLVTVGVSAGVDIGTQLSAQLARIQGFAGGAP